MKKLMMTFSGLMLGVAVFSSHAFSAVSTADGLDLDPTVQERFILAEDAVLKTSTEDSSVNTAGPNEVAIAAGSEITILSENIEGGESAILINEQFQAQVSTESLVEIVVYFETQVAGGFVAPVKGKLKSKPGMRRHPILKVRKYHAGYDYAARTGTPVVAAAAGKVARAGRAGGYGNLIVVNHPGGVQTRYAHLSKILVKTGQQVGKGQLIGKVGSTGRSTGPHLHFEKR